MNTFKLMIPAIACALALGACAKKQDAVVAPAASEAPSQDGVTPGTTDPAAASSPSQREATGAETPEAGTGGETDPGAAATPSQEEATQPGN
jgi:hypothetical protein